MDSGKLGAVYGLASHLGDKQLYFFPPLLDLGKVVKHKKKNMKRSKMQRPIWSKCTNRNPNFHSRQIYYNSHLFNIGPGSDSQIGEFFETHSKFHQSDRVNLLFLSPVHFCRNPVFAVTFNIFFHTMLKKRGQQVYGTWRHVVSKYFQFLPNPSIIKVYNLAVHKVAVVSLNWFERRRENKFKRRRNRAI